MFGPEILIPELVPIDLVRPNPHNPRRHPKRQIDKLVEGIETRGFLSHVYTDGGLMVVAGHARLEALRRLKWDMVPVIRLLHLSPEQLIAAGVADNRLAEDADWDRDLLVGALKVLDEANYDLALTGFEYAELDALLFDPVDEEVDRDDEPIDPGPNVSRLGDLWALGRHKILCGSSLEEESYLRLLGEERAAIGVTDAPYNVKINGHVSGKGKRKHREFAMASGEMSEAEFTAFLTTVCELMARYSRDGSLHYHFMDAAHLYALQTAARTTFDRQVALCVWHKPNAGMGSLYRSAHELVLVSKNGTAPHQNHVQLGRYGRHRTNVWTHAGANVFLKSAEDADLMAQHPTPKPVRLIVEALLDASTRGDIVLEPFCGSGSTLIAAERTGRVCRAIELDPLYVDLTIRRFRRHGGEDAVRQDGMTFSQLESLGGDHD